MSPRSSVSSLMIARYGIRAEDVQQYKADHESLYMASILSGFGLMGFTATLLMLLYSEGGNAFGLLVGSTFAMLLSVYYLRRLHRGARV